MDDIRLKKHLLEEEQYPFVGWDFSHLKGRWKSEDLSWNYKEIVLKYLKNTDNLLDLGTGDGSLLLSFNHSYNKTSVTEAYPPNIKLCKERLEPLGIKVYPLKQDDKLTSIKDNSFDIVISNHESYDVLELKRILKTKGLFITEQVGAFNNKDLATFLDPKHIDQFPNMRLDLCEEKLKENGFKILQKDEYFPKLKFFDLGAFVYLAKIIKWEFLDFSVEKCFDKLKELQKRIDKDGYITSTEHRFLLVGVKND